MDLLLYNMIRQEVDQEQDEEQLDPLLCVSRPYLTLLLGTILFSCEHPRQSSNPQEIESPCNKQMKILSKITFPT